MAAESKTLEDRRAILSQALLQAVAEGSRIESWGDTMAVVVKGRRVNHLLHFIIGIPTFGLWWIVWIVLALTGGEKRRTVVVGDNGEVWQNKVRA